MTRSRRRPAHDSQWFLSGCCLPWASGTARRGAAAGNLLRRRRFRTERTFGVPRRSTAASDTDTTQENNVLDHVRPRACRDVRFVAFCGSQHRPSSQGLTLVSRKPPQVNRYSALVSRLSTRNPAAQREYGLAEASDRHKQWLAETRRNRPVWTVNPAAPSQSVDKHRHVSQTKPATPPLRGVRTLGKVTSSWSIRLL
jgi:hypothetical protein